MTKFFDKHFETLLMWFGVLCIGGIGALMLVAVAMESNETHARYAKAGAYEQSCPIHGKGHK